MKDEDKNQFEKMVDIAKELLLRDKFLTMITFVKDRKGAWSILNIEAPDKDDYAAFINNLLATGMFESYVFISESWFANSPPIPGKRVSEMPNRKEAIIANYKNDTGERINRIYPFNRVDDKIVFEDVEDFTDLKMKGGRMDFWE